jgi:poly(3-hydroxybutyrate) depolymerase
MKIPTLFLCAALLVPQVARSVETAIKDPDGLTSWLYTPTTEPDPTKTYWLVVSVHGGSGNGKGAAGIADWATSMDDVIVLGPSFSAPNRAEIEKLDSPAAEAAFRRDTYSMCGLFTKPN